MNSHGKMQIVINDGAKVRPDWTDRIAISYLPVSERTPIFDSAIGIQNDNHSDLSGLDLTILPVVLCGRAWEFYYTTGTPISTFEVVTDMVMSKTGRYYFNANVTLALNPSEINVYYGQNNQILAWRFENPDQQSYNDFDITITINPDVADWESASGYFDYSNNVVYRGTEEVVSVGNTDALVLYDDNHMHNLEPAYNGNNMEITGSNVRFYIKELGCYTGNKGNPLEDVYFRTGGHDYNTDTINVLRFQVDDDEKADLIALIEASVEFYFNSSDTQEIFEVDKDTYYFDDLGGGDWMLYTNNTVPGAWVNVGLSETITGSSMSNPAINYNNLTSDYQLRKSTIKGIDKVNSGGKYYVEIKFEGGCEKIEMGNVWNKPEWTNDIAGQNLAYNEISEWII